MPLYDYVCNKCQRAFSEQRSIHLRKYAPCPVCHSKASKRPSRFWLSGQGDLRETTDHGCHGAHHCHEHD